MKYRKTMTCGSKPDSKFRHIVIDYPYGNALRVQNEEVGRFLVRDETWKDGIKVIFMEGVEIDPEYRGRGIGKAFVKQMLERGDMIIGSITEDESKPFWTKMGGVMMPIPLEAFENKYLPSITTKDPQYFYITKNPEAAKQAEYMGKKVVEHMFDLKNKL